MQQIASENVVHMKEVIDQIHEYIRSHCPYAWHFKEIELIPSANGIQLNGKVPSFYLRQIFISFVMKAAPGVMISDRLEAEYR